MPRSVFILLAMCGLLVVPTLAQSTIYIPDNVQNAGTCNVIPFGQSATFSAGYTYVAEIPASFMDPANPVVTDIGFTPCGTGSWSSADVSIAIGHLPNPQPCPFTFPTPGGGSIGSFLDLTVLWDSGAQGPFNWGVTQDTWSPMNLAASFLWNGSDNVGFFVTFQNATVSGFNGAFHRSGSIARTYSGGYGAASSATCGALSALKMCLTVTGGGTPPCVLQAQGNIGSGGGVIAYSSVSPLTFQGITLFGYDTSGPVGGGSFLGLYPDSTAALVLSAVLGISPSPGNPLSWTNAPGLFPNAPFVIPAGTFPANLTVDFVGVKIDPSGPAVTNVARTTF
ncbi:MAG: hypothetical protein CMJ83_01595 [Planctomycetes bacterium]|nr:hypothetical protein [Planctomycetota bacterium]